MNRLQFDDAWSFAMFDKLLADIIQRSAYRGRMAYADYDSEAGKMIQRKAHADLTMNVGPKAMIAIDWKFVRFPPRSQYHWKDLYFEEMSCTAPGHEAQGWGLTSIADVLLWCQAAANEKSANCWAFPMRRLRAWVHKHKPELAIRDVENLIDGKALWTRGVLVNINKICRDLKVEGFRVDEGGLISDLWGTPELRFLPGGQVEVIRGEWNKMWAKPFAGTDAERKKQA